jgi:hypothetical protein
LRCDWRIRRLQVYVSSLAGEVNRFEPGRAICDV